MAVRNISIDGFITKLLRPLPTDEEQVDTKKFLRDLCADMQVIWREQMRATKRARHLRFAAEDSTADIAMMTHWNAVAMQMRVPAPNIGALKWKQKHRQFLNGCEAWEHAIARDEEWIAKLIAAGVR